MEDNYQSDRQIKMKYLDQLFAQNKIEGNFSHLKDAIINGANLDRILDQYRVVFRTQSMNSIQEILGSSIVKKRREQKETIKQIYEKTKQINLPVQFMNTSKCQECQLVFQGEKTIILLPLKANIKDAKSIIQQFLDTTLELIVLIQKEYNLEELTDDFILQTQSYKRLLISYYTHLVLTLNKETKDQYYRAKSHQTVIQVKELIADSIGIQKQEQKWFINNKEISDNQETLEGLGIKDENFRITIIGYKNLKYYGFTQPIERKRNTFKDLFIEDDQVFCENIKKSKFPAQQYSQIFRNQALGYIFAAIKKHTKIENAVSHIKSLVESTGKDKKLWRAPSSKSKCFFNQIYVLYYIFKSSDKSLRIDILRGIMNNRPVALAYYDQKGNYVELMDDNYWIQNKAFAIVSFGLGKVMGKSQLLNLIFETNFKNRQKIHKSCQGGIEMQYNIYNNSELTVNLIDMSNDTKEDLKLKLAKASNLIIIYSEKKEEETNKWLAQQEFGVPVVVIFRDVADAFGKQKQAY